MKNKKDKSPMDKLTAGYEKFIKDKEIDQDGKKAFNKAVKKASKPKERGSK